MAKHPQIAGVFIQFVLLHQVWLLSEHRDKVVMFLPTPGKACLISLKFDTIISERSTKHGNASGYMIVA